VAREQAKAAMLEEAAAAEEAQQAEATEVAKPQNTEP
jgi:hypothetical protein